MPAASVDRRFCVAPMMRYSHVHARHLWRRLCPSALLYTEMLTANAVIHGDRRRLLALPEGQSPVALQLGGSEAESLAMAAKIGEEAGYAEINLNCGCPSNRRAERRFRRLSDERAAAHRRAGGGNEAVGRHSGNGQVPPRR